MPFQLLYVCTGNVCRSPMAELLFRSWVSPDVDVQVGSAGVAALEGEGIDGSSATALRQLGVDPGAHRARQFEPAMARGADLILTAERDHRDLVMTQMPSAFRRTFTMKEFARLSRRADGASRDEVIARLAALRGVDGAVPEDDDNMPDPYRGLVQQAKSIAQQITDTVHATIGALDMWPPVHDLVPPVVDVAPPRPRPRPRSRPYPHRR